MNALDRAIAYFAPGLARSRARARHQLRAYDAASELRLNAGWRATKASANAEVGQAQGSITSRARDAVRNDPYAARVVDVLVAQIVGAGISTRWGDEAHRATWSAWSSSTACDAGGEENLVGLQVLAARAMVESGEALVRFLPVRPSVANPVGLTLQVLEADFLDWTKTGVFDGRPTVQGVEVDDNGAPVALWLHKQHPGEAWPLWGKLAASGLQSVRVPVDQVLHLYRKRRPGQLRDVSWLAPALTKLRDLSDYELALLKKAQIEACLAAVVTQEEDGTATTGGTKAGGLLQDAAGNAVESFEPGMILYRRGMGEVAVVNPSGGGSHMTFARRNLEAAAVATGLTYDQVSGDLTGANYSSLRAGKIETRRLVKQVQYAVMIPRLVAPIAERFHRQGALAGLWSLRLAEAPAHVPPAHEMIDPLKDTAALVAQVRAGFVSQADAVASFGADLAQQLEEIKAANKLLTDAGIVLDTDPRRVTNGGQAHNAAQLAAIELAAGGAAAPPA